MNITKITLLTLLFFHNYSLANNSEFLLVNKIIKIHDGDSFKVNLANLPTIFGENITIRIANIDTPELKTKCIPEREISKIAKTFTTRVLRSGKSILLKNPQRGKYFRIVAEKNLGEELLKEGLAVKYDGGKRKNWCK